MNKKSFMGRWLSQTILIKIIIRNESFWAASKKWERKDEKKLIKVYDSFVEGMRKKLRMLDWKET